MSEIRGQIHHKFKAFSGKLSADHSLGDLAGTVATWVREARVAPKSIGVEYVESAARLVLTVGYRDDEPAYEVELRTVPVGKIEGLAGADLTELEQAMAKAGSDIERIICHELYVTSDNEFFMVFMAHKPA